ncbi:MAG: hypothetical protein EZS28_026141 [Streblomastix strix]|uniref:Uncharacterized protein n=1 Tax=Streblomastix strix TaxID=222440 RepID=A0A5J4V7D8_9EUKA|nr:MAG: hypothetical protein EZS28_026141 [Streblomastix strix]
MSVRKNKCGKKHINNHAQIVYYYDNEVLNSNFEAKSSIIGCLRRHERALFQSFMTFKSRSCSSRRQRVPYSIKTHLHKWTTTHSNHNQSTILEIGIVNSVTNPFIVSKGTKYQQIAEQESQVYYASRDLLLEIANVRKRAFSTYYISLEQVEAARVNLIENQTELPADTRIYPFRGPQVRRYGILSAVKNKAADKNTSVIANQNLGQNLQR